jgi:two-component system, LytTR family, response regulator AlgR
VNSTAAHLEVQVNGPRRVRVLVVDDDHLIGARLRELLSDFDHVVVGLASSSIQALVLIKALRPDVVVTDLRMPGMNGLQLANEVLRLDSPPAVVIVSAYDDASLKAEAALAGVDAYVVKGAPGEQIHHAVVDADAARTARIGTTRP